MFQILSRGTILKTLKDRKCVVCGRLIAKKNSCHFHTCTNQRRGRVFTNYWHNACNATVGRIGEEIVAVMALTAVHGVRPDIDDNGKAFVDRVVSIGKKKVKVRYTFDQPREKMDGINVKSGRQLRLF